MKALRRKTPSGSGKGLGGPVQLSFLKQDIYFLWKLFKKITCHRECSAQLTLSLTSQLQDAPLLLVCLSHALCGSSYLADFYPSPGPTAALEGLTAPPLPRPRPDTAL